MSAEAFFYALFPLLLCPIRKIAGTGKLLGIIAGCWIVSMIKVPILWGMLRHAWMAAGSPDDPASIMAVTDYNPLARLPEFVAGMALGRLMLLRNGPRVSGARLSAMTILAATVGLAIAALGRHCPWFLAASGGLTPIFAIIIWNLTDERSLPARVLAVAPLVFLGEASYSIYILHVPLVHWFGFAVHHLSHSSNYPAILDIPSYRYLAIYMLFMLGACSLVYYYFEIPARDVLRGGSKAATKPATQTAPSEVGVPTATVNRAGFC
jgi:peptidoglycan/LPS O-acetylase OafA/YrhL